MADTISIIIVEDDTTACNEFSNYISDLEDITLLGITNSSYIAIDYIKEYLPDVVILDLELHYGSGNGISVLQGINDLSLDKKPYILITTNNSSQITYDLVRQLGADFIMSKHEEDYSVQKVIDFISIMKTVVHSQRLTPSATHATTEDPDVRNKRIVRSISTELNNIGISPKVVGFQYLLDAIQIVIEKPAQNLCYIIGTKYNKTESSVERAIQNAISKAWKTTDIDDLLKYYTARINPDKGVPTITEFIFYYANKIKNEY